jgi:hypothetical protein
MLHELRRDRERARWEAFRRASSDHRQPFWPIFIEETTPPDLDGWRGAVIVSDGHDVEEITVSVLSKPRISRGARVNPDAVEAAVLSMVKQFHRSRPMSVVEAASEDVNGLRLDKLDGEWQRIFRPRLLLNEIRLFLGAAVERDVAQAPDALTLAAWRCGDEPTPIPVELRAEVALEVGRRLAAGYGVERAIEWCTTRNTAFVDRTPAQAIGLANTREELDGVVAQVKVFGGSSAWGEFSARDTRERYRRNIEGQG